MIFEGVMYHMMSGGHRGSRYCRISWLSSEGFSFE